MLQGKIGVPKNITQRSYTPLRPGCRLAVLSNSEYPTLNCDESRPILRAIVEPASTTYHGELTSFSS